MSFVDPEFLVEVVLLRDLMMLLLLARLLKDCRYCWGDEQPVHFRTTFGSSELRYLGFEYNATYCRLNLQVLANLRILLSTGYYSTTVMNDGETESGGTWTGHGDSAFCMAFCRPQEVVLVGNGGKVPRAWRAGRYFFTSKRVFDRHDVAKVIIAFFR